MTPTTNVIGTLNLSDTIRSLDTFCTAVIVTTDKVYSNISSLWGYREDDQLGGHDPYSSSKAAVELAVSSWRSSFTGSSYPQNSNLKFVTARAGNVIGGGDWSVDRIIPDAIRSLINQEPVQVRSPFSTRPWQHVLEPLVVILL